MASHIPYYMAQGHQECGMLDGHSTTAGSRTTAKADRETIQTDSGLILSIPNEVFHTNTSHHATAKEQDLFGSHCELKYSASCCKCIKAATSNN